MHRRLLRPPKKSPLVLAPPDFCFTLSLPLPLLFQTYASTLSPRYDMVDTAFQASFLVSSTSKPARERGPFPSAFRDYPFPCLIEDRPGVSLLPSCERAVDGQPLAAAPL